MKTLDEVIKSFECCENIDCGNCPYKILFNDDSHVPCDQFSKDEDALYYLKMYRSDMLMYAENQKYWEDELKQKIKDFGDAKERYIARLKELEIGTLNDPLTWDELKTMEGKPVWYEHEFWKGWIILGKVEQGANCEMIPDREERWYIVKDGSAKAYRKERATGGYLRPEPQSVKIGSDVEGKWHEADNREGLK